MLHTWKNWSHLKKCLTIGKMGRTWEEIGRTWKKWSRVEKLATIGKMGHT